jgi:predicted metal-binding protein
VTLLICRTCPRDDPPSTGEFAKALNTAIARERPDVLRPLPSVRGVACLGGCPGHGVAALDGPGRARVRFTELTAEHATALLTAAEAHADSDTGEPGDWKVPADLVGHLSSVTVKRGVSRGGPLRTAASYPQNTRRREVPAARLAIGPTG